jgi:nucleoside-diphosphate-sugar epimerase
MGGTRFMGKPLVDRLLGHGHDVVTFNRGTRPITYRGPVTRIIGDRNNEDSVTQLRDLAFDGIIDMSAYTPSQTRSILAMVADVPRYIHCSTGGVYAPEPTLPWGEDTPYGPWDIWGQYAVDKIACERLLQEERPATLATTAIRLPYVLGPANYEDREEFVLNRLLDGAEIIIPGDGQGTLQFVSSEQVAHALVSALETFESGGWRAFNIAEPSFTTLHGFVRICAGVLGVDVQARCVGGGPTGVGSNVLDRANPLFPFPNVSYVLDVRASVRAGIAPPTRSIASMVEDALQTLLASPARRSWSRTTAELMYLDPAESG